MSQDHRGEELAPPRATLSEQALVARSQRGDRDAFNQLLERYQGIAYALALRMLGDAETAADVTQDAFLSAYRAISSFHGTSFRAWLLRIVSNGCYDVFRARGRHPSSSLDALLEQHPIDAASAPDAAFAALLTDTRDTPEELALRGEVITAIEQCLLRLAPDQRLAVVLSDVQGLSYDEIAKIMDTPVGTVKSRIARGRGQLRALLLQDRELFSRAERPASENM